MKNIKMYLKSLGSDIKTIIQLVFIFLIPILIFFSPAIISIWKDNYWYIFLFMVSWLPAIIFAKISVFIIEA